MKKIFSLIPLAILVFSLVSCNGMLDTEQHGVVPTATFYQSDEDCEEATVAVYALFKEMYGDFLGASPWRPMISTPVADSGVTTTMEKNSTSLPSTIQTSIYLPLSLGCIRLFMLPI